MFKMTHPILGTRDIKLAIEFYTQRLGFQLAFGDKTDPPNYVGFRRDAVELHMQFQFEHEMGTIRLRAGRAGRAARRRGRSRAGRASR